MAEHKFYSFLFNSFLRRLDPEDAHHLGSIMVKAAGLPVVRSLKHEFLKPSRRLGVTALGLHFDSPFGMAAGFDKNASMINGLYAMGFGHIEVGTLTAIAQPGNPRPRLFRLVADHALINRMGFNNNGAAAAVSKLERIRRQRHRPIVGVNIGKSRVVDVENAIEDYLVGTKLLAPVADYLVINVSSPNTPGLRGLQELDQLQPLLEAVREASGSTPLLVKIAPDLTDDEVTRIAQLAVKTGLNGIIATNTTLSREGLTTPSDQVEAIGAGGLSGAPLAQRSLAILSVIRKAVPQDFCVISVGGVDSGADVHERLQAGATLVQGYSAFIYRGPLWASRINRDLRALGYGAKA